MSEDELSDVVLESLPPPTDSLDAGWDAPTMPAPDDAETTAAAQPKPAAKAKPVSRPKSAHRGHLSSTVGERRWEELLGSDMPPGSVLADKYRLDELVGHGAMGFVVKAWHLQLEEPVAVKFLLPELCRSDEALGRFEREARAAFKIKSEHVTRLLDVGRIEGGPPFMVLEYLDGEDLGEVMYDRDLTVSEAVDYLIQACRGVAEAHALGIVHRDLKPDNLYLTRRPNGSVCVKVLDFGLSKVVQPTTDRRQRALTTDAQVMGTAHYMSPEQWVASKNVGRGADIWALGVILYEAVTGESPFMRVNYAAMCNAVLNQEPEPIAKFRPDAPPALQAVVDRCLKKRVEERYADVAELVEDLAVVSPQSLLPPSSTRARASSGGDIAVAIAPPPSQRESQASAASIDRGPRPRLGLRRADGGIDSWAAVLDDLPVTSAPGRGRTVIAIAIALAVVAALWFLTG